LVKLEKDGKKCISKGVITDIPVGIVVNQERQFELGLHLLLDSNFMELIPDIHSNPAIVTHLLKLDCFIYPKEEIAGHSVPTKITGIFPIQIYPNYDDLILLTNDASPSTLVESNTAIDERPEQEVSIRKRK
jgi:hypothetical protein